MSYKLYKKKYWKFVPKKNLKTELELFFAPNITKLKAKRNIEGLYKALHYKKFLFVNHEAALALADIDSDEAVSALKRALSDEKAAHCCYNIAKALGKNGSPKAIEVLVDALNHKSISVRRAAADELGKSKNFVAVKPLIGAYSEDDGVSDRDIRYFNLTVIHALGKIGGEEAIKHLRKLLSSGDSQIRTTVCAALSKANWNPDKDEEGAVFLCFQKKWNECALIGEQAITPLVNALTRGEAGAAKALGEIAGPKATKALIKALVEKDYKTKDWKQNINAEREIIRALSKIGDKQAVEPLINMLVSGHFPLEALYALEMMGDERAVDPLISALRKPGSKSRSAAARALGKIGSAKAVEPLIDMLKHQGKGTYSLVSWRDQEDYWAPDDAAIAFEDIIKALVRIGDSRAIKPLKELLDSKDNDTELQKLLRSAIESLIKKNE